MTDLEGRVALVTGAARERGIGRGIANVLAGRGCDVIINDVASAADEGHQAVDEIRKAGRRAEFIAADVSDRTQVDDMVARIEADFGPLGVVASNAGIADWQSFPDITEDSMVKVVGVNLTGAFHVGQAAARVMVPRGSGRIVFTSSVHVQMPMGQMAVYGSTKQAIRALVDHMTVELSPHGVLVNHIGPGWVKSYLNDRSPSLQTEQDEADTIALIPTARPATPEDMGNAVAFLASDQASYVTGSFLRVDGGFVVGKF